MFWRTFKIVGEKPQALNTAWSGARYALLAAYAVLGGLVYNLPTAVEVLAQNVGPPRGPLVDTAAAGTMIAAAMETVGYHAQSLVLAQLSQQIGTLGALVYLGVILSALLTASLLGSYRPALWLLVGPPVFFFASGVAVSNYSNRLDATATEWRFGTFRDTQKVKDRYIEVGGSTASVSYLFHKYNLLVSETSQKLIEVFTQSDMRKQFLFMARQRTFEELFGNKLKDPGVWALAGYFLVQCNREVADARLVALGNGPDPVFKETNQWNAAKERYCERFPLQDKYLPPGPAMDFIYSLDPQFSANFTITKEQHRATGQSATQIVSCTYLWNTLLAGSLQEASRALDETSARTLDWYAWRIFGIEIWSRVISAIKTKTTEKKDAPAERLRNEGDPCPPAGADALINANNDAFAAVRHMVASMMMRDVLTRAPNQELMQRVQQGYDGIVPDEGNASRSEGDPSMRREQFLRMRASDFGESRRYEAFAIINLMPYVQGFLLYALALSYPFFSLLLLVPGQAGGFLNWMALWAWAKSWDVGWAIVMVADDVAWELLPKVSYYNPDRPAAFTSPVDLMEGAYAGDPAYSISTYWMLLQMMMLGVPMVSAQAVLGAKRAIAGRLLGTDGLQGWASRIGGTADDYISGGKAGVQSQKSSQARALAALTRGTAQGERAKRDMERLARATGDRGQISKVIDAALQESMPKLGHSIAPIASLIGVGQENKSAQSDGPSVYTDTSNGKGSWFSSLYDNISNLPNMAEDFLAAGGEADEKIAQNRLQSDDFGQKRVFNEASKLHFASLLRQRLYGSPALGNMDAMSEEKMAQELFSYLGLDPNSPEGRGFIGTEGKEMFEAYKQILVRKMAADLHHSDAELNAMWGFAYMGFGGSIGGPAAGFASFAKKQGDVGELRELGYKLSAQEYTRMNELVKFQTEMALYEASLDPLFTQYDTGRAALSANPGGSGGRGGEFFRYGVYDPNWVFALDKWQMDRAVNEGAMEGRSQGIWLRSPLQAVTSE